MRELRVVGCFLWYQDKFLIVLRHPNKPSANTWGLPAGKVDAIEGAYESDIQAVIRETWEETGYTITENTLEPLGVHIFYPPDLKLIFPTFAVRVESPIEVKLNPAEHIEYRFVTVEECTQLPNLIFGFEDLLSRVKYI
jgi:8-oxo-dGTP pyrophosphatase MutT (NUDIX family)